MLLRKWLAVLMVLMVALVGTVPVFAQSDGTDQGGAVYVMTNATTGNQVIAYSRAADGTLTQLGSFDTGGKGSGVGATVPPDPLGSQNSLLVSPDGKWLFAVNSGSNEVSVFRTKSTGLKLTDRVSSRGTYPVSLTYHDGLLYVLNAAGQGNITGFWLDQRTGYLHLLDRSTRSLDANTPADSTNSAQPQILESPAQVGFTPDGHFLVVTDKGGVSKTGRILVFSVDHNGRPSSSYKVTTTTNPVPFSFTFDFYGHLVVVDASASAVTAYAINQDGSLSTFSSTVTGQKATCWIVFDGGYLFTDNTGSSTISSLALTADGQVSLINGVAADTGMGTLPLDLALSPNGHFLYTLETGAGSVGEYRVNADGTLTSLGAINSFAKVGGVQGIAVR